MAITVEDGSCVPLANALISRAFLLQYAADYQPSLTVPDSAVTDSAIMRASAWMSTFPEWDGKLACGRGLQGQAWPRQGVYDCNGDAVPDDEVPTEVMMATAIASLAELATPGVLSPVVKPGEQRKRVKVDVIEVEYMTPTEQGLTGQDVADALRPVLTAVKDLLKCMAILPDGVDAPWPFVV